MENQDHFAWHQRLKRAFAFATNTAGLDSLIPLAADGAAVRTPYILTLSVRPNQAGNSRLPSNTCSIGLFASAGLKRNID